MLDKMKKSMDVYYEDSIELDDNKWLRFKRQTNYKGTSKRAVEISLEDLETGTKLTIGNWFDGKWYFNLPTEHQSIFWKTVKEYNGLVKEIFKRTRESVPLDGAYAAIKMVSGESEED
jgi:hypothetical protein